MSRKLFFLVLATLAVLALVAAGCGGGTTTTTAGATTTGGATTTNGATSTAGATATAPGTADGAALFAANCSSCHGTGGEGGIGPDLRSLTDADVPKIETQVKQGGGQMPAFGDKLSADEIAAVAAYVAGLQ